MRTRDLLLLTAVLLIALAGPALTQSLVTPSVSVLPAQFNPNSVCLDAANQDTGFARVSAGVAKLTNCGTTNYTQLGSGGITLRSGDTLGFSSSATDATVAADTSAARQGAGLWQFTTKIGAGVSPSENIDSNGAVVARGVATSTVAKTSILDFNTVTGNGRMFARGPDGSTNAGFQFLSTRSDGTNVLTPLAFDASGNATMIGTLSGVTRYATASNCASSASPAVCSSASAGSVVIAAAATSVVVNTTAVTANSTIFLTTDQSLGTKLSVTCNTQSDLVVGTPVVSARSSGTSFTAALPIAPTTNPLCLSYLIIN